MNVAVYIRLSDQDDDRRAGEKPESNSVVNQRALLNRFLDGRPELDGERREFVDDGHSGVNFQRPGIQALLAETRKGGIDCILVKDFSRFGRNYLEVGDYLEQVFPFLGVRFISVNDGYDSGTEPYGAAGNLSVGVRNFINELYSRDLSRRVKAARIQYARRGDCIAAYPIYGYEKDREDRRKLVVDPPAAKGVRAIFHLALERIPLEEIAGELNRRQIPTPFQRKVQQGVSRKEWAPTGNVSLWNRNMVRVILREERYTGKLISNRRVRFEVGNPAAKPMPRNAWIVAEQAIPPLITEAAFQAAQTLFPVKTIGRKPSKAALFAGKLHCGICGRALERCKTARISYHCRLCRGEADPRLYEDELTRAVLTGLHLQFFVSDSNSPQRRREKDLRRQRLLAKSKKQKVLTAYLNGRLSRRDYEAACKEASALEETMEAPEGEKPRRLTSLTRPMVEGLVDDIRVYPGNRLELIWRFQDEWMKCSPGFTTTEGRSEKREGEH